MTETQELIRHLGTLSYIGIFGVSLIANVIVPFPEEIVLLGLGYLAGTGKVSFFIVLPVVIAGLLISDMIMYTLSRHRNRFVIFFYEKFFAARLAGKRAWLESHVEKVIFFSRFLIQLRFLGPFMAGRLGVPWRKFLTYELAALVVYVPLFLWLGFYFRNRIEFIASGVGTVKNIILIIICLTVVVSLFKLIHNFIFGKRSTSDETPVNTI